jgi:hypothetical protein
VLPLPRGATVRYVMKLSRMFGKTRECDVVPGADAASMSGLSQGENRADPRGSKTREGSGADVRLEYCIGVGGKNFSASDEAPKVRDYRVPGRLASCELR